MKQALTLLSIIFVLLGWLTYRLVRYTAQSIGDESPFTRRMSIEWKAERFFTRFEVVFAVFFLMVGILLVWLAIRVIIQQPEERLGALTIFAIAVMLIGLGIYSFNLQVNYWQQFKNRTVTFDPVELSIILTEKGQDIRLDSCTVSRIEHHIDKLQSSKSPKFWFKTFVLADNSRHSISDLFFPPDLISHYFKGVREEVVVHNTVWFTPED